MIRQSMNITGIATFILSVIAGYVVFLYLSHPEKKKHKVPKIGLWNIEFMPNFRVHIKSKTYHFHHWFVLALVILIPIILRDDFQYPMVFKGIVVGGILQGLRYPNKFKFRYPRVPKFADWEKVFQNSSEQKNPKKK